MKRALELSLAISLALGAGNAWAVGLGQIQVKSRLNQPLVAEIPVTVDRGSDAETLSVSLASAEEFSRIGIERSQIGVPLEFTISKGAGGQTVIRVTSIEPVRAPFLDFLVAANWSNGRVLREYTVLLDPPSTAPAVAAMPDPVVAPTRAAVAAPPPPPPPPVKVVANAPPPPAAVEPAKPASKPVVEPDAQPEPLKPVVTRSEPAPAPAPATKPEPRPQPASVAVAPPKPAPVAAPAPPPRPTPASKPVPPSVAASNGSNYGPVAAGETLWEIAQATLPDDGVSANQLMLALLKANPQAFSRNNINRLKRGAILRIPTAEDIRAVGSMREATAQVRSQVVDWRQQDTAPTLLAGTAAANVSKTETPSTTTGKTHDDRLALVPPEMGNDGLASTGQAGSSSGTAAGNASAAELARANETLVSAKQEAGELRSRVKDLEDLKSKNDRLISLKDSAIADLQRKLAAAQADGKQPAISPATPPQAIDKAAEVTAPVEPASTATTAGKDDIWGGKPTATPAAGETPPGMPALADTPESTATTGVPGALPPAPAASMPEPDGAPLASTPASTEPTAAMVNPGDSDIPALTPPAAVDEAQATDEKPWYLDPRILGGAGIIVLLLGILALRARRKPVSVTGRPSIADRFASTDGAAGTVVHASDGIVLLDEESQLAEQIAQHPDDLGARLELLSIYYADNRVEEFRAGALEMQPHVDDPSEAEWVQVRAMGEDLLPHDPLFISADRSDALADAHDDWSADDGEPAADPDLRWSDDGDDDVDTIPPHHNDMVVAPFVASASDDLSRYAPVAVIDTPAAATPGDTTDFAPGYGDEVLDDDIASTRAAAVESDNGLDFSMEDPADLDFPVPAAVASTVMERNEPTKPRALTESDTEPKKVDDSFEFDLPPLDFESEFSKPVSAEQAVDFNDEVGEDLDEEFLIGEDALGTKLDLARAYADMGDRDGARGMLEEVIAEGDVEQQDQARKLLEELR